MGSTWTPEEQRTQSAGAPLQSSDTPGAVTSPAPWLLFAWSWILCLAATSPAYVSLNISLPQKALWLPSDSQRGLWSRKKWGEKLVLPDLQDQRNQFPGWKHGIGRQGISLFSQSDTVPLEELEEAWCQVRGFVHCVLPCTKANTIIKNLKELFCYIICLSVNIS